MKYLIIKYDVKPNAKSYDDIQEDKYLEYFELDHNLYPSKRWTRYVDDAIHFYNKTFTKHIIDILGVNSPYPMKIEEIE